MGDVAMVRAAHCMIWCPTADLGPSGMAQRAHILVRRALRRKMASQMISRHDGRLGFPGGKVDLGETVIEAMKRELMEEVGLALDALNDDEHLFEKYSVCRKHDPAYISYFYVYEVAQDEFALMERQAIESEHYGFEVMGLVRPPLHTSKTGHAFGLPHFLGNRFAGDAREQLMRAIVKLELFGEREMNDVLRKACNL